MKYNYLKLSLLFLSILFLCSNGYSQRNFIRGYIIPEKGDTIKGFIDYRDWAVSPERISFTVSSREKITSCDPLQIKEFGVANVKYVSTFIEIEIPTDLTGYLASPKTLNVIRKPVFLRTLIEGSKSLFSYVSTHGKDQFYIKKDSVYELLKYRKYLTVTENSSKAIVENKLYYGQLLLYLNDCPDIRTKLERTEYNSNSLYSLFLSYYKIKNEAPEFKNLDKVKVDFTALGGVTWTSLDFTGYYDESLLRTEFNNSVNFAGGLSVDLHYPGKFGRWSLNNELMFVSYQVKGQFDEIVNEDRYTINKLTIGYSSFKVNTMIRYKHNFGKFNCFANIGWTYDLTFKGENVNEQKIKFYGDESTNIIKPIPDPRNYDVGWVAGLGVGYKRFSFQVRKETNSGMSDYPELRSRIIRWFFFMGIQI